MSKYLICLFCLYFLTMSMLNSDYEELIHVNVFHERDERHIPIIQRELAIKITDFQFILKSFPDIEVHIDIAPDRRTYEDWIRGRAVVFENSQGFTDLAQNRIFIKNPVYLRDQRALIQLLMHEYIHLFIHYHWSDAPLWFHEGMAVYFTENLSINRLYQFTTNNAFHSNYLLLRYAYMYPDDRENIEPFYVQATLLIRFIVENNLDALINLFDERNRFPRFSDSFQAAFHTSQIDFLGNFEREIQKFFRTNIYIGIILLTWLSFPLLLIIARIRKHISTKQILEEWDIEDDLNKEEIDMNNIGDREIYNFIVTKSEEESIDEEK